MSFSKRTVLELHFHITLFVTPQVYTYDSLKRISLLYSLLYYTSTSHCMIHIIFKLPLNYAILTNDTRILFCFFSKVLSPTVLLFVLYVLTKYVHNNHYLHMKGNILNANNKSEIRNFILKLTRMNSIDFYRNECTYLPSYYAEINFLSYEYVKLLSICSNCVSIVNSVQLMIAHMYTSIIYAHRSIYLICCISIIMRDLIKEYYLQLNYTTLPLSSFVNVDYFSKKKFVSYYHYYYNIDYIESNFISETRKNTKYLSRYQRLFGFTDDFYTSWSSRNAIQTMPVQAILPFNEIDDNDLGIILVNNNDSESLRGVIDESRRDYSVLASIDPDSNFLNSTNSICKNYTESEFNSDFSLLLINIRSIPRNLQRLYFLLEELDHRFSIIALSESWLNNSNHIIIRI